MGEESNQQFLWFLIILSLLLFAGAVLFFNEDLPENQQAGLSGIKNHQGRVYSVFYTNGVFSPTNLQINIGDTVRFVNDSLGPIMIVSNPHPEHADLPGFDSLSDISPKGTFVFVFTKRGIFDYHNER